MAQSRVYVAGSGATKSRGSSRFSRFFAVVALDGGVFGLAGDFGCSVGSEGTVSWGGARREGLGVEFWGGVISD